jgi:hypothetical protein
MRSRRAETRDLPMRGGNRLIAGVCHDNGGSARAWVLFTTLPNVSSSTNIDDQHWNRKRLNGLESKDCGIPKNKRIAHMTLANVDYSAQLSQCNTIWNQPRHAVFVLHPWRRMGGHFQVRRCQRNSDNITIVVDVRDEDRRRALLEIHQDASPVPLNALTPTGNSSALTQPPVTPPTQRQRQR